MTVMTEKIKKKKKKHLNKNEQVSPCPGGTWWGSNAGPECRKLALCQLNN
jgi:hypothetical protein